MVQPGSSRRRLSRLLVALLVTGTGWLGRTATAPSHVAAAGIARVQTGAVAQCACASVTATLSAASTAGDLLVATLADAGTAGFTGPAGWTRAAAASGTGSQAEVWYYAGNPGGITSATFTSGGLSLTFTAAQLSEWSGVVTSSPLDGTGTATAAASSSVTASTPSATTVSGDLAIASFTESAAPGTFTPGAGWTNLGSASSTLTQDTADQRGGNAAGTLAETETSSVSGSWGAVIAAFKPVTPCSGGVLGLTVPAAVSFGTVTLNGQDQSVSVVMALTPDDETGSGAGWSITGTSTLLTNGAGRTLPATATTVSAGTAAAAAGNCSLPATTVSYSPPITLPAGSSPPAPARLYNAAAGSGAGPSSVSLTLAVAVPANAYQGSFSSSWTIAIGSGP